MALIRAEESDAVNAVLFFFRSTGETDRGAARSRALALKGIRVFREIKIMDTNCTGAVMCQSFEANLRFHLETRYSYRVFE